MGAERENRKESLLCEWWQTSALIWVITVGGWRELRSTGWHKVGDFWSTFPLACHHRCSGERPWPEGAYTLLRPFVSISKRVNFSDVNKLAEVDSSATSEEKASSTHILFHGEATCFQLGEDQLPVDLQLKTACRNNSITLLFKTNVGLTLMDTYTKQAWKLVFYQKV